MEYCYNWTDLARECYERGCVCRGCIIKEQLESPCQMKRSVFELVRKFGAPPKIIEKNGLTPTEQKIINAILNGADSFEKLAVLFNRKTSWAQNYIHVLYDKARERGWVGKRYSAGLFPEFIKWVRKGGFNEQI